MLEVLRLTPFFTVGGGHPPEDLLPDPFGAKSKQVCCATPAGGVDPGAGREETFSWKYGQRWTIAHWLEIGLPNEECGATHIMLRDPTSDRPGGTDKTCRTSRVDWLR